MMNIKYKGFGVYSNFLTPVVYIQETYSADLLGLSLALEEKEERVVQMKPALQSSPLFKVLMPLTEF